MCAITLATVGALTSAVGTVGAGIGQANSLSYQAQVAKNNAKIAGQNAAYAASAGQAAAEQESLKGASRLAKVRTELAANNIDVNSGSAVDVQQSEREANKLSTLNTVQQANLNVYGYRTQQTSDTAQSQLDETASDLAVPEAALGATGSLLSKAPSTNLGNIWTGVKSAFAT